MSEQNNIHNIPEEEFIKGVANGAYTPNDAVKYSRECFDKEQFLSLLYVYTFTKEYPLESQRHLLKQAKVAVYRYLVNEGYKFEHNFECWGLESNTQESNSDNTKSNNVNLPKELDTDRARIYFARAIEKGYMEKTDKGYKWLYGGNRGKVRLGYFLVKVFCQDKTDKLPQKAITKLFGVERMDSAINQLQDAQKLQKWIPDIDNLFND